jgi:hypothetical protein
MGDDGVLSHPVNADRIKAMIKAFLRIGVAIRRAVLIK